jgi:hypothetical protein
MEEPADQAPVPEGFPGAPRRLPPADVTGRTREDLAVGLEKIAGELGLDFEQFRDSWPTEDEPDFLNFWRLNLAKIKARIDMVQNYAERCRKLTGDEAGEGQKGALKDLDEALLEARICTQAALRALQVRDDASQSPEQSRQHMEAVGQLAKLAIYCKALLPHLRPV